MPPDLKTNMSYGFKFDKEHGLLKVMVYGKANPQNMRSRLALLETDDRWKNEYKLLIDYSCVTAIDRPESFCNTIRELLNEIQAEKLPAGIAYIFPERLFAQCFDRPHSEHSIKAGCKIRFFRQEGDAIDWLEKLTAG